MNLKLSANQAMAVLIFTAIVCDVIASLMANNLDIAIIINVGTFTALMVGWTYIQAVRSVVQKAIITGEVNLNDPLGGK